MARWGIDPKVLVSRFDEKAAVGKRVLMGTKRHRSCVSLWRERSSGDELAVTGKQELQEGRKYCIPHIAAVVCILHTAVLVRVVQMDDMYWDVLLLQTRSYCTTGQYTGTIPQCAAVYLIKIFGR